MDMDKEIYKIFESYKKVFYSFDIKANKVHNFLGSHKTIEEITDKSYDECNSFLNSPKLDAYRQQIAVKLTKPTIVIDVENKKKDGIGLVNFKKMYKELELPRTLLMRSKSGGLHAYYKLEDDDSYKLFNLKYNEYEDIEFLWFGRIANISDSHQLIKIERKLDIALLKTKSKAFEFFTKKRTKQKLIKKTKAKDETDNILVETKHYLIGVNMKQFRDYVRTLIYLNDSNSDYNTWFLVIVKTYNLVNQFIDNDLINIYLKGYSIEQLIEWSKQSEKYVENEVLQKWESLNLNNDSKARFTDFDQLMALSKLYVYSNIKGSDSIHSIFDPKLKYSKTNFAKTWGQYIKTINELRLHTVDRMFYKPYDERKIIEDTRATVLNTFNQDSIAKNIPFEDFKEKHQFFARAFLSLLVIQFGYNDALILYNYIAFLLQRFGERSQVAIILHSKLQGVGKSTIANVIRTLLGSENCKTVSNESMQSSFTSYVGSHYFIFWDEVAIKKNNIELVTSKIRMLCTQHIIAKHAKGVDEIDIENVSNIMLATNDLTQLNFYEEDRRWIPFSVNYENKDDFKDDVNREMEKFGFTYDSLFKTLKDFGEDKIDENYRLALASYFYNKIKVNNDFFKGDPVHTEAFKNAVLETKDKVNGFIEIQDLLDSNEGLYYSSELTTIRDIKSIFLNNYNDKEISKILKLLGYKKHNIKKQLIYNAERKRSYCWVRNCKEIDNEIERLYDKYSTTKEIL